MSDNLNDVKPDTDIRNDRLNEILNSVDSRLQNKTNTSKWEDGLTSAIAKRSYRGKVPESCEDILDELDARKARAKREADAVVSAVLNNRNSSDDVQELIEQLTVAKKVSELSSQKKKTVAEVRPVAEVPKIYKAPQINEDVAVTGAIPEESEEVYSENITENYINEGISAIPAIQEVRKPITHESSERTLVYNVPVRASQADVRAVREAVATAKAAQVRKPVRKIVRVDKTTAETPKPSENVVRNTAEQVNIRQEKNVPKKKKKKASFKDKVLGFFPQKNDSALEKVRKVVFLGSICAIVVCGYMVGDYYIDLWKSKNLHDDIAEIYETYPLPERTNDNATVYEPDSERIYTLLDGAKKLLDRNPDVIGYITIPNTPVANPVMQSSDNNKYLDQNIDGDSSRAGELFLDYRNNFDRVVDSRLSVPNSDNLVIYGHNMANDTMFGSLKYYQRNYNYYTDNPVIYLNSNYECYTYKIFSYFILDALDESETAYDCWNKLDFDDEKDFYNFVNEAKKRSLGLNDVDVKYGDKLLTLSTCNTVLGDRGRLIIMGRLLRDGEDARTGTDKNTQNANVKWPSIYYQQKPNEKYNPDAEFIPYGPDEEE
ncbi:MAG: class B sortase [Ruminococcus sp.]|nr:class B sortase [Ruminococcus sp.]